MSWVRVIIIASLLLTSSGRTHAALGENRAFESAKTRFALNLWEKADSEFGQFIENFPKSEHLADAVLLQAQAKFKLKQFPGVVSLLAARHSDAGARADEFIYWTAQAQFQGGQFQAAAESFGKLAREFPMSPKRLEAAVGETEARAKRGDWKTVAELLRKTDGAFRQAMGTDNGDLTARGLLLQAEAGLVLEKFSDTESTLNEIGSRTLSSLLQWQRGFLLCRAQLGLNRTEEAQRGSTNLPTLAMNAARPDLAAQSVVFGAEILEKLGRRSEAAALLSQNLTNTIPVDQQRHALEKIVALYIADGKPTAATEVLENYLERFTNSPAADVALLTLGELYLKRHVAGEGDNLLTRAMLNLDRCVTAFPDSPLRGKVEMNRGWCLWLGEMMAESGAAFARAAEKLPSSENLAVARFKLADCQIAMTNYSGALQNYRAALSEASRWPRAKESLTTPALYQTLRAALALTNPAAATDALRAILETNPKSSEADRGVLLVTQGLVTSGESEAATGLFKEFTERFPDSELRPQMDLIMARAAEKSGDWTAAQSAYGSWLEKFGTNGLRAKVQFLHALATARSGNETNALGLFTNLVATCPTNEFAPIAQWWVADYFSRQDSAHLVNAELGYKLLAQTWPETDLGLQARMMAGRMAMLRADTLNAIEHFTNLTLNPKCTGELRVQALTGYGGALMRRAVEETNRITLLEDAIKVFKQVRQENAGTEIEAEAWRETGKCYLQMAGQDSGYYSNALQSFQTAAESTLASVSVKSESRVGLATTCEQMAKQSANGERMTLLKTAQDHYAAVVDENRAAGDARDLFWLRKACLEGGRVSEQLPDWGAAAKFYGLLCDAFPQLRPTYQRKIDHALAEQSLAAQK